MRKKELIILLILIICAFSIRLYQLETITPGMYGDEVSVAQESIRLLQKDEIVPYVGHYSHATPLMYMTATSINIFGHTITAIRLPSVLIGALTVGVFFFLVRLFLPLRIALLGTILLLFQYAHLIVSRLAYEAIASLFFQMLVAIFLYLYYRSGKLYLLIMLAVSIGLGLYTYLNYYLFAFFAALVTIYFILKMNKLVFKQSISLLLGSLFIVTMPLLSYVLIDGHGSFSRIGELSIFSKGYSLEEFTKELSGNIYRTSVLPFIGIENQNPPFIGDPNPGKNPAGMPMFDPIIVGLAIVGFVHLFFVRRKLFLLLILFMVPPFISDILSTEIIPELHYYGLGHPNTLRLSGVILIILFAATFGLHAIKQKFKTNTFVLAIVVIISSIINMNWYFNQMNVNRTFYLYNYKVNNADVLSLLKYINAGSHTNIAMTSTLMKNDLYIRFFLNEGKSIIPFRLTSVQHTKEVIRNNEMTAIEINESTVDIVNAVLIDEQLYLQGYSVHEIKGIVDQPDIMVFQKTSQ